MTTQDTPLENWTAIDVDELPARFPDDVDPDDGPFGWKNVHNDVVLHVEYDAEEDEWIVTGSNSVVGYGETLSEVQSEAREYMRKHPRPSAMVG